MTTFDRVVVVDWSAARRQPKTPRANAIWAAVARGGVLDDVVYLRGRHEAAAWLSATLDRGGAGRTLAAFDFPLAYPAGFARAVAGTDDPLAMWDWLAARIVDPPDGTNNRFAVAAAINGGFPAGPFWGRPEGADYPEIPRRKTVDWAALPFAEWREADRASGAGSSCFQLSYHPTVGGQALTGLPVLSRLRRRLGVAVWPFKALSGADVVLAEVWPGLIEPAVRADPDPIRDRVQVARLALALSRLPGDEMERLLDDVPDAARIEGWILGTGAAARLTDLAVRGPGTAPPPGRPA